MQLHNKWKNPGNILLNHLDFAHFQHTPDIIIVLLGWDQQCWGGCCILQFQPDWLRISMYTALWTSWSVLQKNSAGVFIG